MDAKTLIRRFSFHPADTADKQSKHAAVQKAGLSLAGFVDASVPDGYEKDQAIAKLQEVMFWCNAGIARNY